MDGFARTRVVRMRSLLGCGGLPLPECVFGRGGAIRLCLPQARGNSHNACGCNGFRQIAKKMERACKPGSVV